MIAAPAIPPPPRPALCPAAGGAAWLAGAVRLGFRTARSYVDSAPSPPGGRVATQPSAGSFSPFVFERLKPSQTPGLTAGNSGPFSPSGPELSPHYDPGNEP